MVERGHDVGVTNPWSGILGIAHGRYLPGCIFWRGLDVSNELL